MIRQLHGSAGFGHHIGDGIAPRGVMRGFLVRGGRFGIAVHFVENKAVGVVVILQYIKPRDARLLDAVSGVLQRRLAKGLNAIGFHVDMNEYNQHEPRLPVTADAANKMRRSIAARETCAKLKEAFAFPTV